MKNLLAALSITGMTLVSASAMAMDDFESTTLMAAAQSAWLKHRLILS